MDVILVVALCAVVVYLYGLNLVQRWRLRGVPGPRPSWLLGNLPEIKRRKNFILYEACQRTYGPMFRVFMGMQPIIVVSDAELAREVGVRQFSNFHDRPLFMLLPASGKRLQALRRGMLLAKGAYWASIRAAAQPMFHTPRLSAYAMPMHQALDTMLDQLAGTAEDGQPIDIWRQYGRLTLDIIGYTALGVTFGAQDPKQDQRLVRAWTVMFGGSPSSLWNVMVFVVPKAFMGAMQWLASNIFISFFAKAENARNVIFSTSCNLVSNARKRLAARGQAAAVPQDDWKWWKDDGDNPYKDAMPAEGSLIDILLAAKHKETGRPLAEPEIVAQSNTFMGAGYETTANALSFATYLVAQHPAVEAKLLQEVDRFGADRHPAYEDLSAFPYAEAVLKEAMRLYPPAVLTPRVCNATTKVGGHTVREGAFVHINIYGIHRNAAYWPEPEAFRPERFLNEAEISARHPNAYLPFGLGPRMCVGWKLAVEEALLTMVRIHQRFTFRLAEQHVGRPLQLRQGITIAPQGGLWVTPVPRKNTRL